MSREILKTQTSDQGLVLLEEMQEWILNNIESEPGQWYDQGVVEAMTDEELLQNIESRYVGGLQSFIENKIFHN